MHVFYEFPTTSACKEVPRQDNRKATDTAMEKIIRKRKEMKLCLSEQNKTEQEERSFSGNGFLISNQIDLPKS